MQPKERGKLLPTHTAAALAKHFPPPGSRPSVGDKGGAVASPHPGGSKQLTDEGVPKSLSRKTLVEFPQKIPPPFPEQASDSDSSSSSSTSSSSDSESDEEGSVTQVGPRMTSRGKGETAHPSKKRHPQSAISAKEKNRAQKPDTNVTYPEKPHQPKKKGTLTKPLEDSTEAKPKHLTPRSQADEEVLKQNLKEEQLQKILRLSEIEKESQKLFEVKEISPEHTKTGLSAGFSGGQVSIPWTEPTRARGQLPASDPGDPKVPEPGWEAASPLIRVENVGKQVTEGHSKAKEEILGDPVPVRNLKVVPVEKKGVFDEMTAGLTLKGGLEETVSAALHMEDGAALHMEDGAALHVEDSAALHMEDAAQHAEAQGDTQGTPCLGSDSSHSLGVAIL